VMLTKEEINEVADVVYNKVVENIKAVLEECDLNGISALIYVKNPSVKERLEILEGLETLFSFILTNSQNESVKAKIDMSRLSVIGLKLLLGAVSTHDQDAFEHARGFLEKQVDFCQGEAL